MNMLSLGWIYAAQTLMSLVFNLAVLIYVATRPADRSSAKTYALIGFGIGLLTLMIGSLAPMLLASLVGLEAMAISNGILLIGLRLLGMAGTCFVVAAIFTGRPRNSLDSEGRRLPINEQNPYASP